MTGLPEMIILRPYKYINDTRWSAYVALAILIFSLILFVLVSSTLEDTLILSYKKYGGCSPRMIVGFTATRVSSTYHH
jgi:hypothetical protein